LLLDSQMRHHKLPDTELVNVALFPIPNIVAFPGTVVPLHVFEPRYRQLVHDCVEDNRMIGVCHTIKTIHEPAKTQSIEQALSSNQATYKPQQIFSAGDCEIVKTTDDGRIIASITMRERLLLVEEIQSLPYRIVSCQSLTDELDGPVAETAETLQYSINNRLIELLSTQNAELVREFQDPEWLALPPADFSFRLFQYLKFDADVMQEILELRSAHARLDLIWAILKQT